MGSDSTTASVSPRAVLFDLDGTLINSIELIQRSKDHAFQKRGRVPPTDEEWLTGVGIPLATMFERYAEDRADVAEFIRDYREFQLPNHDRLVQPYAGALETLATLRGRGHPIGIVTSKSVELAERGLTHVGLAGFVDTIVGADSCARHKPHPEPVLLALERLQTATDRAVFIGDSVHDIEAGNAAGVVTIAALWGPFTRAELVASAPAHFLAQVGELPDLLGLIERETGRPRPA
jgi:pyrophosphatase PpaX